MNRRTLLRSLLGAPLVVAIPATAVPTVRNVLVQSFSAPTLPTATVPVSEVVTMAMMRLGVLLPCEVPTAAEMAFGEAMLMRLTARSGGDWWPRGERVPLYMARAIESGLAREMAPMFGVRVSV